MSIGPVLIGAGLGLAATVAPLTSTALAAAPSRHAGIASAINNDVARAAGLIAVAVLPAAVGITGYAYQHTGPQACQPRTAMLQLRGGRLPAHQH